MYVKYTLGFLVASLAQALIIVLSEYFNISNLNPKYSIMQFTQHFITGIIVGYIILYLMRRIKDLSRTNTWILGGTFGLIFWSVGLSIQSMRGAVSAPWEQGFATVIVSMLAFIVYGYISVYTIKKYGYEESKGQFS